jgi:hypothetical protein
MAADLVSDLEEAEAEGVSAEELLGAFAADPRAFAASWAGARGIIPEPPGHDRARRKPPVLVAFTALAATAVVVAALLLVTGEPRVALETSVAPTPSAGPSLPSGAGHRVHASAAAPVEWILLVLALTALGFAVWLWRRWGRSRSLVASAR